MSSVRLVSRTVYHNGCAPLDCVDHYATRRDARRMLARLLRQVRHDVDVVFIRAGDEAYYLTNTVGPCVFERTVRVLA